MKKPTFMSFVEIYPSGNLCFVGNYVSRKSAWWAAINYINRHNFDAAQPIVEVKKEEPTPIKL